ncbi:MAG: hypothetical protein U9N73_03185 [Candidatus Auribacterota bacterium]|nr:hypothetical protein [Candidatus Auribacterota bacterium]
MSVKKALQLMTGVLCLSFLITIGFTQETATEPPPIETMADMEALFAHEPGYQEIQQAAMRYAEVHPDKIAAWRRGASLRAFLPEIDFDYDYKKSFDIDAEDEYSTSLSNSYSSDYGTEGSEETKYTREYGETWDTENPGEVASSLREKWSTDMDNSWSQSVSSGEDRGESTGHDEGEKTTYDKRWRVVLSWDLRDFLYNKEQTRISKEARELVELRQDVLEEVNTYFFDRRRAQIEMIFSPPEDARSRIDVQLQIARVTASIDALTGGYLSNALQEAKTNK